MWKTVCLFLFTILFVMGVSAPALADGPPEEGRDYKVVRGPKPGATYVRVMPGVDISTPELAKLFKSDQFKLRAANPQWTLALCKVRGDGYRMGRVPVSMRPDDVFAARRDETLWAACPEELKYVYIVPGSTIEIRDVPTLTTGKKIELADALLACEGRGDCITKAYQDALGVTVQPPTATAAVLPTPVTPAPKPLPVTPVAQPAPVLVKTSKLPDWFWWGAAFIAVLALLPTLLYADQLRNGKKRLTQSMREYSGKVSERTHKIVGELNDEIKRLRSDLKANEAKVETQKGEIKNLVELRTGLKQALSEFALEWGLLVPSNITLEALWSKVILPKLHANHAEKQSAIEQLNAALSQEQEVRAAAERKLEECQGDLDKSRNSFDDVTRNRQRFAELYPLLRQNELRVIHLDSNISSTQEHIAELERQEQEETDDLVLDNLARQKMPLTDAWRRMSTERSDLQGEIEKMRDECSALFESLTGLSFMDAVLYKEALQDRNAAAADYGKVQGLLEQAQTRLDALNGLETARAEAFKKRETEIDACITESRDSAAQILDLEKEWHRLMRDLLVALNLDGDISIEEIKALGGTSGVLGTAVNQLTAASQASLDAADRERGLAEEIQALKRQLEEAVADSQQASLIPPQVPFGLEAFIPTTGKTEPPNVAAEQSEHPEPRQPTVPWIASSVPKNNKPAPEALFDVLGQVFGETMEITVDTPKKAWLLYDFLTKFRFGISLDGLFSVLPSNYSQTNWDKLRDSFTAPSPLVSETGRGVAERFVFIINEMTLEPPLDYTPLMLARAGT